MKDQLRIKLQNLAINVYTFRIQICKVMAILSTVYLLLSLFQIKVLMGFAIFLISVFSLCYFKWRNYREVGFINMVSPKLKKVLLQRSIYDLYRDQVYFPYFTKIIGLLGKGAISKPHPEQLDKLIDKLPQNVRMTIFTKGILHLAPQKVQQLIIQKQPDLLQQLSEIPEAKPKLQPTIPKIYGTINNNWDRIDQYEKQQVKIHENTISKQLLISLNQKIQWGHVITLAGLVAFAVTKTKGKKLGKILLYNGSVVGIMVLAAIIIIKYKKPFSPLRKNKD